MGYCDSLGYCDVVLGSISLIHPPLGGAPKKTSRASKKSTSSVATKGFKDHPVMISNNELFVMMKRLEQQVTQHQEDNKFLLKEMERIRAEIHKPQEAAPSILQTKIQNFDNTGSLGNRREIGSSTPPPAPT